MAVCRFIGWFFIVAALSALVYEMIEAFNAGGWRIIALGETWFKLHTPSLNTTQAVIQRYIAPWLWEPVITTILLWPGWIVFGVPGGLMIWLCHKRKRYFEKRLG